MSLQRRFDGAHASRVFDVTQRECEVMALVVPGLSNNRIAGALE